MEAYLGHMAKTQRIRWTYVSITLCLNLLLWSSLGIFCLLVYMFMTNALDVTILPPAILMLASFAASVIYLAVHLYLSRQQVVHRYDQNHRRYSTRIGYITYRLIVSLCLLWLFASAWNLIMAARQPICLQTGAIASMWRVGTGCVLGKICAAFGVLALFASCVLSAIVLTIREPFDAHIFGYIRSGDSHGSQSQPSSRSVSMAGDKFIVGNSRSSLPVSDLESCTIAADGAIGLGIYMERPSSLTSLPLPQRSDSLISIPTPLRPIQPLVPDSAWRAVHPPSQSFRQFSSPTLNNSHIRTAPPSPALLGFANRRFGHRKHTSTQSSRSSCSSESGSFPRSPLSSMRRASEPDILIEESRARKSSSDSVPSLPELQRVSQFPHPLTWHLKHMANEARQEPMSKRPELVPSAIYKLHDLHSEETDVRRRPRSLDISL